MFGNPTRLAGHSHSGRACKQKPVRNDGNGKVQKAELTAGTRLTAVPAEMPRPRRGRETQVRLQCAGSLLHFILWCCSCLTDGSTRGQCSQQYAPTCLFMSTFLIISATSPPILYQLSSRSRMSPLSTSSTFKIVEVPRIGPRFSWIVVTHADQSVNGENVAGKYDIYLLSLSHALRIYRFVSKYKIISTEIQSCYNSSCQ